MRGRRVRYTEEELRSAIAASKSWTETLRRLGYCPTGGNPTTVKKYAAKWGISAEHFDPFAGVMDRIRKPVTPLEEILVRNSTYGRSQLKQRLYGAGLKRPACEICGQGEMWRGETMSMILDHINGVRDDNRIENLRIVCPNCAATLDTHCGRSATGPPPIRSCLRCREVFRATYARQKYCSRYCGIRQLRGPGRSRARAAADKRTRKVERPAFEVVVEQVERDGFSATGRRYGVSDNAIRKWLLWFEREAALQRGEDPPTLADIRRKYGRHRTIRG